MKSRHVCEGWGFPTQTPVQYSQNKRNTLPQSVTTGTTRTLGPEFGRRTEGFSTLGSALGDTGRCKIKNLFYTGEGKELPKGILIRTFFPDFPLYDFILSNSL